MDTNSLTAILGIVTGILSMAGLIIKTILDNKANEETKKASAQSEEAEAFESLVSTIQRQREMLDAEIKQRMDLLELYREQTAQLDTIQEELKTALSESTKLKLRVRQLESERQSRDTVINQLTLRIEELEKADNQR